MTSRFVDTYQRYKQYTNEVVQWLVDTDSRCGHTLNKREVRDVTDTKESSIKPVDEKSNKPGISGRLKGRVRKLATQAAREESTDGRPDPCQTSHHRLAVAELLSLAKSIAADATTIVPIRVLELVRATIGMRKECLIILQATHSRRCANESGSQ